MFGIKGIIEILVFSDDCQEFDFRNDSATFLAFSKFFKCFPGFSMFFFVSLRFFGVFRFVQVFVSSLFLFSFCFVVCVCLFFVFF